jgi:predicted nuclease of predicted toxin-antitoxin system
MRIVIDEDLPRSITIALTAMGHEVFDIRDHKLRGEPDEVIFEFAQKKRAVLFSGDLGFGNTIRFPLNSHHGIVILRFPNEMSTKKIVSLSTSYLKEVEKKQIIGNLFVFSPKGVRMRKSLL